MKCGCNGTEIFTSWQPPRKGIQVSVAHVKTELPDIQGTVHHIDIQVQDAPNGGASIMITLDLGTEHNKTPNWAHTSADMRYKRCLKGTVGFFPESDNNVSDFKVQKGPFRNRKQEVHS